MAIKNELLPLLDVNLEKIETDLDQVGSQVWSAQKLKQELRSHEVANFILQNTSVGVEDLILYLIKRSHLRKVSFRTPRIETLYLWKKVDPYQLLPTLRPSGYYSHMTAMYFHRLLKEEPENIYLNHEQPIRTSGGPLQQSRIDLAFKGKQRITHSVTSYDGRTYWLLNGKQTGNTGVEMISRPNGSQLSVTNLERTLIDITVRPAYAGGVKSVLQAFRLAQSSVSVQKLAQTLRNIKYVYPYHQSIGFYIDVAGNYSDSDCLEFLAFQPFNFDFYLDYEMANPRYSPKWRIHYPTDIIA